MKIIRLWDSPEKLGLYNKATIRWSYPKIWHPDSHFEVPDEYFGHGGLYMLIRDHWKLQNKNIIVYIGKTKHFIKRLKKDHPMHKYLVKKPGKTKVSCGLINFHGAKPIDRYFYEIEKIIIFSSWDYLENTKGFGSFPGFWSKPINPWIIENVVYRGRLPKRIFYPAFAIE